MAQAALTQATAAEKAVDRYFEAWNARDLDARVAALRAGCSVDVVYTDPNGDAEGHQALSDMMEAVQVQVSKQQPEFSFLRTSTVDEHHGRLRFNWALKGHDGAMLLAGVDFGHVDDDGRLRTIVGFFGEAPAALSSPSDTITPAL